MNILHVVPSYIPAWRYGGPIHSVHGLCKALAARGHHVQVATTNVDGEGDTNVPLDSPVDLDGVEVRYFPSKRLRRLYYSPPLHRFIASQVPRMNLIHAHSVYLWPTTVAAHLARKAKKPYVLSPRGMLVPDLIARRSRHLKQAWLALFEKRNVENAAAIHVTSRLEGEDLLATGLRPRKMFEIPNGLDLPEHDGAKPGQLLPGLPETYVLFLGRISWKKGLDRLVSALPTSPALNLVVAGNDDENYWPTVLKIASERGVAGCIHYVGYVEGETKRALLSNAMMLVLPSYSENFGNVVLEAMSLGTPVVVTPDVGLSSVVAETRSGIVVSGDAAPLGRALADLASNTQLRSDLGRNARSAARLFGWDAIAQRFEEQYQLLVSTNPPSS